MHELEPIVTALARHRPGRSRLRRHIQRAAVAVVLRESVQGAQLLLVERAHRVGDPWSGDMAFPGGRVDAADAASASRAACRETAEEIGLYLTRTDGIGRLSDQIVPNHRRRALMVVSPFVYRMPDTHAAFTTNHEISGVQWITLAWLDEPENRQRFLWHVGRLALRMPCYDCGGQRRLWGLTLRMIDELRRVAVHR